MMRFLSIVFVSFLIVGIAAPSQALTQEEILKRRLERMQQADPEMRKEEQQREEQMLDATNKVASKPAKVEEPLYIPGPQRANPDPRGSLWDKGSTASSAAKDATQPVGQPVGQPAQAAAPQPVQQPAQTVSAQPTQSAPQTAPQAAARDPKAAADLAAKAAKAKAGGDMPKALSLLNEAVTADPTDADLFNNRGNILNNLDKPKDALTDYDRAISLKTSDPAFFSNRGLAHERLGNQERACSDYKRACDLGDCDFYKSFKKEGHCR